MTAGGADPSTTGLTVFANGLRRGDHAPAGVAAPHQAALPTLELALQFVHHGVESGHRVARHRAGPHHVAAAASDKGDLADFALGGAPMRLLDKPDLGPLDAIEIRSMRSR
jgi:hypothetical protein